MHEPIRIDEAAAWTSMGGSFRFGREPGPWLKKSAGSWERKELVPFGKANPDYRAKYFRCAECGGALLPCNVSYRFGCSGCGLVFGWGFGGLWGFPPGHEKAMYLTDHISKQSDF